MAAQTQIRRIKIKLSFPSKTMIQPETLTRKRRKTAAVPQIPVLGFDDMYEILLRTDPQILFNCVLVSKEWLQIITGPDFRPRYEKRWGNASKLAGFLKYGQSSDKLLATSKLGRTINEKDSIGIFLCKSSAGDGLVLSYISQTKTFCVSSNKDSFNLGAPKERIPQAAMAITSDPSSHSYKVILAEANLIPEQNTMRIQTYSSSTGKWVRSILSRSTEFTLKTDAGIVTSDGAVYFRAVSDRHLDCLAKYEPDNGVISLIYGPEVESEKIMLEDFNVISRRVLDDGELAVPEARSSRSYGLCKRGYLRCASRRFGRSCPNNDETIKIWSLENGRYWNLLYSVDPTPLLPQTAAPPLLTTRTRRSRAAAAAEPLRRRTQNQKQVGFVSFVPGRSDSVYLTWKNELFVYNFETCKMEKFYYEFGEPASFNGHADFVPLTMAELGVWPSCPATVLLTSN